MVRVFMDSATASRSRKQVAMKPSKAEEVAYYIIAARARQDERLTQLKLQKLLYYAQAWHLGIHGHPLFEEDMEAWVHGPVVPSIRRKYQAHRWSPLPVPAEIPALPISSRTIIDRVLAIYGKMSAYELEHISHSEEPWVSARHGSAPTERSKNVIAKTVIRRYYERLSTQTA
jgi:uncharacterized phage-associated protein